MAANIFNVENQWGVDIVASDQFPSTQTYFFITRGGRNRMHAS